MIHAYYLCQNSTRNITRLFRALRHCHHIVVSSVFRFGQQHKSYSRRRSIQHDFLFYQQHRLGCHFNNNPLHRRLQPKISAIYSTDTDTSALHSFSTFSQLSVKHLHRKTKDWLRTARYANNKRTSGSSNINNSHPDHVEIQEHLSIGRFLFRSWSTIASSCDDEDDYGNQNATRFPSRIRNANDRVHSRRWPTRKSHSFPKTYDDTHEVASQLSIIFRRLLNLDTNFDHLYYENGTLTVGKNDSLSCSLLSNDEIIDMLQICLYWWREVAVAAAPTLAKTTRLDRDGLMVGDPKEDTAMVVAIQLMEFVEGSKYAKHADNKKIDSRVPTQRRMFGPKTYSMLVNVLSEYPHNPTALQHVLEIHHRLKERQQQDSTTLRLDLPYYNSILHALSKFSVYHAGVPILAEQTFDELCNHPNKNLRPDSSAFVSLLRTWGNSLYTAIEGAERCEAILETMIRKHPHLLDERCFNVCIDAWAKRHEAERAESLLWRMIELSNSKYVDSTIGHTTRKTYIRPTNASFDSALVAWAKSGAPNAATNAYRLFERMRLGAHGSIEPTHVSLASVLEACSKMTNPGVSTQKILDRFEEMYSRGDVEIAPNKFCYLHTIMAWSRSNDGIDASPAEHAEKLVRRMEYLSSHDDARLEIQPCVIIYTALVQAWARSSSDFAPDRALDVVRRMQENYHAASINEKQRLHLRPNIRTFNALLSAFCQKRRVDEAYALLSTHEFDIRPELSSYHIILKAYSEAALSDESAAHQSERVVRELQYACLADQSLRPTLETYELAIKAWKNSSTFDSAENAEIILMNMLQQESSCPLPDTSTLNLVLQAWTNSTEGGAAHRAENLMDSTRGLIAADAKTYFLLIQVWARSGRRKGPRKAERYLEELKCICEDGSICGTKIMITTSHFNGVLEAYSRDAGNDIFDRFRSLIDDMKLYNDLGFETRPDHWTFHNIVTAALVAEARGQKIPEDVFSLTKLIIDQKIPANPRTSDKLRQASLSGSIVARKILSQLQQ